MQTTDLIDNLAGKLRPLPHHAAFSRLAIGLIAGALLALLGLYLALGFRADLGEALQSLPYWRKLLFATAVLSTSLLLCRRLGRPEARPGALPWLLVIPVAVLMGWGLIEIYATPAGERMTVWLGRSALVCPWIIAALSLPLFAGVLWAFRELAPTRPRLAGFAAGCCAGAAATVVYTVHCPEVAASFAATWYTAGILVPAFIGLIIGPRVLRW
jgi:hypothetical protein